MRQTTAIERYGTWRSKPGSGSIFLCVKEGLVYMPTLAQVMGTSKFRVFLGEERSPTEVWYSNW